MSWPSKHDRARGRLVDARDQPRQRRLAAAGLADQADGLARGDVEIDAVDRVHDALLAEEPSRGSGKCLTRPRTSSSGSPLHAVAAVADARRATRPRASRRRQRLAGLRHPAARRCVPARRQQRRVLVASARCGTDSARAKRQPVGQSQRIGRRALDRGQPSLAGRAGRAAARR